MQVEVAAQTAAEPLDIKTCPAVPSAPNREVVATTVGTAVPAVAFAHNEFAAMVAFLASDRASYTTGASIPVDGGWIRALL